MNLTKNNLYKLAYKIVTTLYSQEEAGLLWQARSPIMWPEDMESVMQDAVEEVMEETEEKEG